MPFQGQDVKEQINVMTEVDICLFSLGLPISAEGHVMFNLQVLHEKHNLFGQGLHQQHATITYQYK